MSDSNNTDKAVPATENTATRPVPQETVTLTIDGMQVTAPRGSNVLEAARSAGIDISAFCYHPGLSIAAVCRQCLVQVEKNPKLQPSCQITVTEGMVVNTQAPEAVNARRQMLEFTLVNHPIDCPICDKAGECTLQKLYFEHDNKDSRVDVPKVRKPKVVDLGPHIVLDAERCILCTRCIRVCDEVAGVHQLEMSSRGDREQLGTAPGALLDNPYSLNTVDVCPVGALTSKDFRFSMRAWELFATPSVCNGCATGCNMEIHHKAERVYRLVPRHNPDVNQFWMCDEGRFTYHALRQARVAGPVVDGLPARWETALARAAGMLKQILERDRSRLGVVLSAQHGNEDNYALARLARDIWQLPRLFASGKAPRPERADQRLRDADVNPNSAGVRAIAPAAAGTQALEQALLAGELDGLLVLGHELPLSAEALARAAALPCLVVIADSHGPQGDAGLPARAQVLLAAAAWAEVNGTVTNRQGLVQRMHAAYPPVGQALPAWEIVSRLAQSAAATMNYSSAKQVFQEMSAAIPAFQGAAWGREVAPLQLRFAGSRG
jgi:NADH-quinone oxidoreductase subunit G